MSGFLNRFNAGEICLLRNKKTGIYSIKIFKDDNSIKLKENIELIDSFYGHRSNARYIKKFFLKSYKIGFNKYQSKFALNKDEVQIIFDHFAYVVVTGDVEAELDLNGDNNV